MNQEKLEVGQRREWDDQCKSTITIDHIGTHFVIVTNDNGDEDSYVKQHILSTTKPVKPEPKEIKVKCFINLLGDIHFSKEEPDVNYWREIDFIDGKFYEKSE